jgi:hypothetical protein
MKTINIFGHLLIYMISVITINFDCLNPGVIGLQKNIPS